MGKVIVDLGCGKRYCKTKCRCLYLDQICTMFEWKTVVEHSICLHGLTKYGLRPKRLSECLALPTEESVSGSEKEK